MAKATGWSDAELARLRMEGLEHLNRLQSGAATDRDAAEFLIWRTQSTAHEEAFQSAVRLRDVVRHVSGSPEPSRDNVVSIESAVQRRLSRRTLMGGAIAASFAGGLFVAGRSLDLLPPPAELRADYRTAAGERRLVRLAGGATVDLNTRTSIALRDDLGVPAIELINGEAVVANGTGAHARAAVVAGSGTSIGSGGKFNARRDGSEVCITCLTGKVDVAWSDEKRTLRPLDQVRYDDSRIGSVTIGVDPAVITAWQSGTLIFQHMPMHAVVDELNRYRPGKIYLVNEKLAARSLTGTYYVRRLDEFFSQAELGLGVKVTRLPGSIVILS